MDNSKTNSNSSSPKKDHKKGFKYSFIRKPQTKEYILELLLKNRSIRTKLDNKIISEYLASTISFFSKLNNPTDIVKLEKLTSVLNYEMYSKDETIINYGEEGDKFYVLIEGTIIITKPVHPQKTMLLSEYIHYMKKIKYDEKNTLKYERVIEKNSYLKLDMDLLFRAKSDSALMKQMFPLFIEEEEVMGEYSEPFSFGDIALIKRAKRNATIKALKECKIVTIEKSDYNKIIRELEEKRLEKQLKEFKQQYALFYSWSSTNLIMLFNCFSNQTLSQGDYLYKQNEESDSIYLIKSGTFEMYSLVSFAWVNEFFEYIIISKGNVAHFYKTNKLAKDKDLHEYIEQKQIETGDSPCMFNLHKKIKIITSNQEEDNFEKIQNDQNEILDPCNLYKVLVKRIFPNEVIGIEDAMEVKKRLCFVKCISSTATVDRIKINSFYKLLSKIEDNSLDYLLDIIANRKLFVFKQILNATKQRAKTLGMTFAFRCQKMSNEPIEYEEKAIRNNKYQDNIFFDHTSMVHDISAKVFPHSLNKYKYKNRNVKQLYLNKESSEQKIFSTFLNYQNNIITNPHSNVEQKPYKQFQTLSSKTRSLPNPRSLSYHPSSSNMKTLSRNASSYKKENSRNKKTLESKTTTNRLLITDLNHQKGYVNNTKKTLFVLKTKFNLHSKANSLN